MLLKFLLTIFNKILLYSCSILVDDKTLNNKNKVILVALAF